MRLQNLKHPEESVSFVEAVLRGIGCDHGLYFPTQWPRIPDLDALFTLSFQERALEVLSLLIGDEMTKSELQGILERAFTFEIKTRQVREQIDVLELFHGPTLAFKDFGARFMAQLLARLIERGDRRGPLTILSATSGDTGAAVAHAFYRVPNVQVVILYPQGRISSLQEKLFCTLGENIRTLAVDADFDTCQSLVKAAFADAALVFRYGLNSANSINMSRVLAQVCYYVEACAQLRSRAPHVVSVPCGNFGNLTAGMIAWRLGLPISAFVVSTNANDTVPRYLARGIWEPHATVATMSNAMDVALPSNWSRVECLGTEILRSVAVNEEETMAAMRELARYGYVADPHTAVAYRGLEQCLQPQEHGIFLSTAHPAKFQETVERVLGIALPLPQALAAVADKTILSQRIPPDLEAVKAAIVQAWKS